LLSVSTLAAEVVVDIKPFEPPYAASFEWKDKFAHPKEINPPTYVYPEEMRRAGISGEVVAVVMLAPDGAPERISILYDTMERSADYPGSYFSTAVIEGLKKARWEMPKKAPTWFYVKTTFTLIETGDTPPPAKPGAVVGVMPFVDSVVK